MKIYNEAKTREIDNPDLNIGKLIEDKRLVKHYEAVEATKEVSHVEVVKEYENGGKEYRRVIDIPARYAREAYDEYEDINIFVPFTEKEQALRRIAVLKAELFKTDYMAIKYAEGELSESEYADTKRRRAEWRAEINRLEGTVNG